MLETKRQLETLAINMEYDKSLQLIRENYENLLQEFSKNIEAELGEKKNAILKEERLGNRLAICFVFCFYTYCVVPNIISWCFQMLVFLFTIIRLEEN